MKEQYSVYYYDGENGEEQAITLPKSLLREADINPEEGIEIECGLGVIIITPNSILGRIPEELLRFYEDIGLTREVVEAVIGAEAEKAGGYDQMLEKMRRANAVWE